MDEMSVRLDDETDSGEYFTTSSLYLTTVRSYCLSGLRGSFILPLIYVILGVHTSLLFRTNVTRCSKSTQSLISE